MCFHRIHFVQWRIQARPYYRCHPECVPKVSQQKGVTNLILVWIIKTSKPSQQMSTSTYKNHTPCLLLLNMKQKLICFPLQRLQIQLCTIFFGLWIRLDMNVNISTSCIMSVPDKALVMRWYTNFSGLRTCKQNIKIYSCTMSACPVEFSRIPKLIHKFPRYSMIHTSSAKIQIGENSDRSLRRFLPILKRGVVLTIRIASASPYTARYSLLVHQFWAKICTFMYQLYNLFWSCVSLSSCGAVFMLNELKWITT